MCVRVLFLEPSLVRVRVGVCDTVMAVLVVVLGVLVVVLDMGVLVRGIPVVVLVDVYPAATLLGHSAPFIEACYVCDAILSWLHLLSAVRRG